MVEGQTGWAGPAGDPQTLAEVLHKALSDPAGLARLGDGGRAWYERESPAADETLEALYARLARRI